MIKLFMFFSTLIGRKKELSVSDRFFLDILKQEGLPTTINESSPIASRELCEAAKILFSFIPPVPDDPRWVFAQQFALIRSSCAFDIRFAMENCMTAVYLSGNESFREGYKSTMSEPNVRQICRAMANLEMTAELSRGNSMVEYTLSEHIKCRLVLTDRINTGVNTMGITGCPEAVNQLQAFSSDGDYLGRIGFNAHRENRTTIISITNIQGVPDVDYGLVRQIDGIEFFNGMVRQVKMAANVRLLGTNGIEFRGLRNPKRGDARLYNSVLKKEKVKRCHYHYK